MQGESDLGQLLRLMRPELSPEPYGIVSTPDALPADVAAFASIAEAEGTTLVAPQSGLRRAGMPVGPDWARISLTVHSDLAAVGLTAAIATALAAQSISANVIAGFYHDHVFVAWDRRHDAMAALAALSAGSGH